MSISFTLSADLIRRITLHAALLDLVASIPRRHDTLLTRFEAALAEITGEWGTHIMLMLIVSHREQRGAAPISALMLPGSEEIRRLTALNSTLRMCINRIENSRDAEALLFAEALNAIHRDLAEYLHTHRTTD